MSYVVVVLMGVEKGLEGLDVLVLRQRMLLKISLTSNKNFPACP